MTITGTNFPATITVTINGITATVTSATSTKIIITIPAMSDFTGPIKVNSTVSSDSFTVMNGHMPSVYWTDQNSPGTIRAVGINGGTVIPFVSSLNSPMALAVDATSVYWTEEGVVNLNNRAHDLGMVKKVGNSGGAVTTLASGLYTPDAMTTDTANIYWTEGNLDSSFRGAIKKVGKNGGVVQTLYSTTRGMISSITSDTTHVYWTGNGFAEVGRILKSGGSAEIITDSASPIAGSHIVSDSTGTIYWIQNDNLIRKTVKSGTLISSIATVVTGSSIIYSLAADAANIYWGEVTALKKMRISDGAITIIAPAPYVSEIALDATSVYFVDGVKIKKVGKEGGAVTTLDSPIGYNPWSLVVDP